LHILLKMDFVLYVGVRMLLKADALVRKAFLAFCLICFYGY